MKHAELIARLEGGETGRDLDAILWYTLVEKPEPGDKIDKDMIDRWPLTTSLDAAVALVERVRTKLNGWKIDTRVEPVKAAISWGLTDESFAAAPTPAAALVAALLKGEG